MKCSNFKRFFLLIVLSGAAAFVAAAPAPVTDLSSSVYSISDIERLQRLVENKNENQAKMQQQVTQLSEELSEMRGSLERSNYEIKKMIERQKELYLEIDELKKLKTISSSSEGKSPKIHKGVYAKNNEENEAYENAVSLILEEKNHVNATIAFQEFIASYPESVYLVNAHYWLGQLFFIQKEDVEAAKNFAKVAKDKESNKRADALYKLGEIARRNNKYKAASKYYNKVLAEYPNNKIAESAKKQLSEMTLPQS